MVSYLREAAADGRVTMEEFSERVEAVNRSRTVGELDQLTQDLPIPPSPRRPTRWLLAALGSVKRAGRLRVGRWSSAWWFWAVSTSTCARPP